MGENQPAPMDAVIPDTVPSTGEYSERAESLIEAQPELPLTLAIDVGGTRIKAGVLNPAGTFVAGPDRVNTPDPATPEAVLAEIVGIVTPLGAFDRISVGFPGVVRHGIVYTAPNLGTAVWRRFPLAQELSRRLGRPTRLLNDASVQGLGVISGSGLECVITLGTGFGFALFEDGRLAPHLEVGQHPVRGRKTYDKYLGTATFERIGRVRWNRRLQRALGYLETLVTYDILYIGGGNAKHIRFDLPSNVHIVSNQAGIIGGVRLWDKRLEAAFAEPPVDPLQEVPKEHFGAIEPSDQSSS